jgi:hypothetical protein
MYKYIPLDSQVKKREDLNKSLKDLHEFVLLSKDVNNCGGLNNTELQTLLLRAQNDLFTLKRQLINLAWIMHRREIICNITEYNN